MKNESQKGAANDASWQALLARSSTTFTGESAPPYGFVTALTARLQAERGEVEEFERIGWRALWASASVLALAVAITFGVSSLEPKNDLEPGLRSVVQVENLAIS